MKKAKMLALGLLGASALFFTACTPDEDVDLPSPNLTVTAEGGGVTSDADGNLNITAGTDLTFTISAAKVGGSDLSTIGLTISGVNSISPIPATEKGYVFSTGPDDLQNADEDIYNDELNIDGSLMNNEGVTSFRFTVTDNNGKSTSVTIRVTVEPGTTPLSSAQTFQWRREGSAAGTGLAQFGLKWTSNSSTSAIVTTDAATRFVELNPSDWNDITTKEALAAAIEGEAVISSYTGVSSQANGTYNDVLGVRHNNTYYILKVNTGTVTSGSQGTTITIDGLFKN